MLHAILQQKQPEVILLPNGLELSQARASLTLLQVMDEFKF